jgi:hypothetical protein
MDMALALISHLSSAEKAQQVATYAEYRWNCDPNDDPFCDASALGDAMEPSQPA